jgi:diguanylate cyclase (GGDEF)-like protein/PAS domain S-box-containing protein
LENLSLQTKERIEADLLSSLIDAYKVGICSFNLSGTITYTNAHCLEMFGFTMEEVSSKSPYELFYREDFQFLEKEEHEKQFMSTYTFRGMAKDKTVLNLELISYESFEDSVILTFKNRITQEYPQGEECEIGDGLANIKYALDQSFSLSITDLNGNISYVNDRFCEVSKYSRSELIGHNHRIFKSEYHTKEFFQKMWSTIKKGQVWRGDICNLDKDGKRWWAGTTIVPLFDEKRKVNQFIAIRSDITKKKKVEKKLYDIAYYDFLTNLPNRRLFESQLEHKITQAKEKEGKFTLILLDLHGIKFVNDSLGTKTGDRLIRETARRLEELFAYEGTLSRIDGDEFCIILPDASDSKVKENAEKVLSLFEHPFVIDGYELPISANIGISVFPYSGHNMNKLMRNAYSALNESKIKGRNCYQVFSFYTSSGSFNRYRLKLDLPKALKNNQFFVEYQPRVDAKTNMIIGAEALVRWKHPKIGLVSPGEFISLAEEDGFIGSIGEKVLVEACQQNVRWQKAGLPPIVVSVNFSVTQFLQSDMIETVQHILKSTGLHPRWLEIELTETALIKDESTVSNKIERLKDMGVKTAIDDFGTGYASLSYLKNLKASTLKIDKSFIDGIPVESNSYEIVSSIIQLAKKLDIRTVAEGVETIDQLSMLRKIHCDEIQGYFYSKPVSPQRFEHLLRKTV